MSATYKHQGEFALTLARDWLHGGTRPEVRKKIRGLKNKAQAAYIAARIVYLLMQELGHVEAQSFLYFIHPDRKD